jgi:hypothetical protein
MAHQFNPDIFAIATRGIKIRGQKNSVAYHLHAKHILQNALNQHGLMR